MEKVNCYRENNNFGYTKGEIFFKGECDNVLVISDRDKVELKNIQDSFMVFLGSSVYSSPISNFREVFQKSEELLRNVQIKYHRPEKVKEREDLDKKNIEELSDGLNSHYGIKAIEIERIEKTSKIDGVFYIRDAEGKEYVLKHYGWEKKRLETLAEISNSASEVFPQVLSTRKGVPSWEMGDGHYGLEEFIRGNLHIRDVEYFSKVGESMARMHTKLNELFGRNENIKRTLYSEEKSLSESNFVSLWIDLTGGKFWNAREELRKLTKTDLRERILSCPKSFIHGDINNANVIWTPSGPKFIDIETVRFSRRILDFEGTMLFQGNMLPTDYVPNSLEVLTKGYNSIITNPLQKEELSVIPELMSYALLKNFVIRNIRRGDKRNSLDRLNKNLSRIKEEDI